MKDFILKSEYIELFKLIKFLNLADSGGMAKLMISNGKVLLNGQTEFRKKAKIRPGDMVEVNGEKINII